MDFQLCFYGSVSHDFWYFITNAVAVDVKINNFDEILEHYHTKLVEFLEQLSYTGKVPRLKDLQLELLRKSVTVGVVMAEGLPTMLMDKGFVINVELICEDSEEGVAYRDKMFANKRYVEVAGKFLKFLHKRGYLDF